MTASQLIVGGAGTALMGVLARFDWQQAGERPSRVSLAQVGLTRFLDSGTAAG